MQPAVHKQEQEGRTMPLIYTMHSALSPSCCGNAFFLKPAANDRTPAAWDLNPSRHRTKNPKTVQDGILNWWFFIWNALWICFSAVFESQLWHKWKSGRLFCPLNLEKRMKNTNALLINIIHALIIFLHSRSCT
jgi:hypothetical protein